MDTGYQRPKRSTAALSSTRLFNADSPITKQRSDIQTFLSVCLLNWTQYSEEEKEAIVATMPAAYRTLDYDQDARINCPISPEFVAGDRVLRDQIARFKRDVTDGYYTKTWQEKARKAMEERKNGKFNEYLTKHAEELFVDMENEDEGNSKVQSSDGEYGSKHKGHKVKDDGRERRKRKNKMSRGSAVIDDVMEAESGD